MLLCLTVTTTHSKINGDISLRVPFGLLEGGFQASKLLVSCILLKFVNCRWITGAYSAFNEQKMTDLTDVRLAPCSTFSFVGIYDFGPSYLTHKKTHCKFDTISGHIYKHFIERSSKSGCYRRRGNRLFDLYWEYLYPANQCRQWQCDFISQQVWKIRKFNTLESSPISDSWELLISKASPESCTLKGYV